MKVIYLIRHGQASFGAADYDRLSARGVEQSRVLGAALRDRVARVDLVATGGQRRHRETAAACMDAFGAPVPDDAVRELRGLGEYDHGELLRRLDPEYADTARLTARIAAEADPHRAFQEIFARAAERWSCGRYDGEYAETWPAFRRRCMDALGEAAAALETSGTALVFSSGGPISAVCQELMGLPSADAFRLSWSLVNCGVTKVLCGAGGFTLSSLNEHAYFEGARRELITYR